VDEHHISELWAVFVEMDTDRNGFWTVTEVFELVKTQRISTVAPFIEALFLFADRAGWGTLGFDDFLVTFTSFCALSKEEVLQFMFMVVDMDRNGYISKEEIVQFFSYRPSGPKSAPVFPANDIKALELFLDGKWERMYFDEFALLTERFPYVSFTAFQLQNMLRLALLGKRFWDKWDEERVKIYYLESESQSMKVTKMCDGEKVVITKPGRFTMKELLEYSKRKTALARSGDKERRESELRKAKVTQERDEQISRTPLLNMVRNPRCGYHVPYIVTKVEQQATKTSNLRLIAEEGGDEVEELGSEVSNEWLPD
jgi:Ca2+-binding EF-hand superfamily protein